MSLLPSPRGVRTVVVLATSLPLAGCGTDATDRQGAVDAVLDSGRWTDAG